MRISKTLILLAILSCFSSKAQQEYQFANTVNNPFLLNPAAGGMTDVIHLEASTRMQWVGYDGGPNTTLIAGNSQIRFGNGGNKTLAEFNQRDEKLFENPKVTTAKSKHVIGGKIWNDAIGPFAKTSIQGSYAYHLPLTKNMNFGVGIGLGYSNFRLDESKVVLHQADDNVYSQFLGNSSQQNIGDAQAGFVVYSEKMFFGISGTQMLKNDVKLDQIMTQSNFNRHAFLIAKYKFDITDQLQIEPSVITKMTQNSPISFDFGTRAIYKNAAWFGVQYRTSSSLIFQIGSNLIKNFYLCYAYEQSIGKLRTAGNSTHEIQLGYYLGKNRNVDKEIKNKSAAL